MLLINKCKAILCVTFFIFGFVIRIVDYDTFVMVSTICSVSVFCLIKSSVTFWFSCDVRLHQFYRSQNGKFHAAAAPYLQTIFPLIFFQLHWHYGAFAGWISASTTNYHLNSHDTHVWVCFLDFWQNLCTAIKFYWSVFDEITT